MPFAFQARYQSLNESSRSRRAFTGLAAALALCAPVLAQPSTPPYPTKTITIVVPFSAGGGVDSVARMLADKLRVSLGQAVVVDNKPGASAMLGAQAVVKAPPDGHTLLLGTAGETAINPHVYKERMAYKPERDLAPVSLVVRVPNVLVAQPGLPVKSVEELVAYAKKNPGKLSYGTSGVGNPQHLNGELLGLLAGVKLNHVPYRGASNQLVDVAAGNVDLTFVSLAGAQAFIKAGRVKPLGITSAKRLPFAPDLPAIAETPTLSAYTLENWFGLFAPAATPEPVVRKLHEAVSAALKDPTLQARLREQGAEPAAMEPAAFREFVRTESARFAKIVAAAGITPDN
ncbi:tripartite tricarboxylate transporter substrate binding protein [Acidovorax sp. JHL-9]|uniref:Bug family tripartite tricarboxylate transporter substrate binding protein n=1 Tax=Acidovorax sp. JHL-9 TaxID=1276756 RepID=UPI000418C766|nr:tripartite tricarboxylate transporter substrate binding protein [Acidovorax sp. JHL-9]